MEESNDEILPEEDALEQMEETQEEANEETASEATDDSMFTWNEAKTYITGLSDEGKAAELTSIVIPKNVTTIGKSAFEENTTITSVSFEEDSKLAVISEYAFYGSKLQSITLPDSLQTVEQFAFYNTKLTEIVIPKNVTSIDKLAFAVSDKANGTIKNITINSNKLDLPNNGEQNGIFTNQPVESVSFVEGITSITAGLFRSVNFDTSIVFTIPKTVKTIGAYAFYGCGTLKNVVFEEGSVLTEIDYQAFYETSIEEITLPDSLQTVESYAFYNTKLTEIVIPKNVTCIEQRAFATSKKETGTIKKITINSNKLEQTGNSIANGVFSDQPVETISYAGTVTKIPAGLFRFVNFGSTVEVSIPSTVTSIGKSAFSDTSAGLYYIPASVKTIEDYAFTNKSSTYKVIENSAAHKWLKTNGFTELALVKTLKYTLNGGVNNGLNPLAAADKEELSLYAPTKTGYKFLGWFVGTTELTKSSDKWTYTMTTTVPTFVAKWEAEQYKLTLDYNVSEYFEVANDTTNFKATFNGTYPVSTLPKVNENVPGYRISGWYLDEACTKAVTTKSKLTVAGDNAVTLYAKWASANYTITFDANGGTKTAKPQAVSYLIQTKLAKNVFTKEGYAFACWNTKADGLGTVYTNNDVFTLTTPADVTLYAQWRNTFYLSYDANGGTIEGLTPQTDTTDKYFESYTYGPATALKVPTRTGYTFAGWYTDNGTFKKKVASIKKNTGVDYILYAKWTANKYTVKFDANVPASAKENNIKATGKVKNLTKVYDTDLSLPTVGYEIPGYKFMGWATAADAEESAVITNLTIDLAAVNKANVSLYAVWKKVIDTYTVHYDLNLPEGVTATKAAPADQTLKYGKTNALAKYAGKDSATSNAYAFMGWATESSTYANGGKVATPVEISESETTMTLKGVWKKNFNVYYYPNGGTMTTDADTTESAGVYTRKYTYGSKFSHAVPVRTGYTFGGWYTAENLKTKTANVGKTTASDLTAYAKWTPTVYTLALNSNAPLGTNNKKLSVAGKMASAKVKYGDTATLKANAYIIKGYKFTGWTLDAVKTEESVVYADLASIPVVDICGRANNKKVITLYAQWVTTDYDIVFDLNSGKFAATVDLSSYGKAGVSPVADSDNFTMKYEYDAKKELYVPVPKKLGYTFAGWYSDSSLKKKVSTTKNGKTYLAKGYYGNVTLYAKWTPNK